MTMPPPVGPVSMPEYLMARALISSATFRSLYGVSSASITPEQAESIKFEIIDRPDPDLDYFEIENLRDSRPFVCIWPFELDSIRIASQAILFRGNLQLLFERNYPDSAEKTALGIETESEVLRYWKNTVGLIIQESFAGSHDRIFNVRRMGQLNWWTRSPVEPEDQHLGFSLVVEWGPDE